MTSRSALPDMFDHALREMLPSGWSVLRERERLWLVRAPAGWMDCHAPLLGYGVEFYGTRVAVTHDNADADRLHAGKRLVCATIRNIAGVTLDTAGATEHDFTLGDVLWPIFRTRPPNRYGPT